MTKRRKKNEFIKPILRSVCVFLCIRVTQMKQTILFLLFMLAGQFTKAQYSFSGTIMDKEKKPLPGVQVMLSANDSLFAAALTNEKGRFVMDELPRGEYSLQISYPGFTSLEEKRIIQRNIQTVFILMEERNIQLDDFTVTADRREIVKRTATGELFYLSDKAKNSGDPYRALREIPRLIVNEALQSVKMEDGSFPLVLIDGKAVNSGITPIDPKEIESVEVIDVVGARYLRTGAKNILNLKLKKKRAPYQFFQTATRHDIPLRNSFGVVYFEVGNSKYSLYGRGAGDITYNDDGESETRQKDTGYFKQSAGKLRDNDREALGELLFKWSITDKDYLAAHIYGKWNNKKSETAGNGRYETAKTQDFHYTSLNRNEASILTSSLYYRHDFSENKMLETTLAYNKNGDNNTGERHEAYPDRMYNNLYEYKNNRSSASLNVDYSWEWNNVNSLNIGSATDFVNDRIDKVSENVPVFHHRAWNEYLYASFGSKAGNLLYMASAGLEGIWLKAGDASNRYIKPRASLSGTYNFNKHHSTRINYTLTNQSPNVGQLNPYNTSTDSLVITRGNPGLLPEQTHRLEASHTFNKKGFYITPSASYTVSTDIIQPSGYSENGIFVNTYRNTGHLKTLSMGGSVNYRLKNGLGNIYMGAMHNTDYFSGLSPKESVSLYGGIWIYYKKWIFGGDVTWRNYEYTPISRIRQLTPSYSQFQVNYNFTKDFYVAVALPYFIGKLSTETTTQSGTYNSYLLKRMTDMSAHPWVLLRYTFRRNSKEKIKLDNVVKSKEEGISLSF